MKSRFPYKFAYENFNKVILTAAQHGENYISFDLVDSTDAEFENSSSTEIEYKKNRVYEFNNMGLATCDMHSYPNYLVSKGFGVEIQALKEIADIDQNPI